MTAVYPSPWPEIRGEVDYACAGRPRVADPGRGSTMRQRSEDDFRLVERCVFSGNVGDLVGADARSPTRKRAAARDAGRLNHTAPCPRSRWHQGRPPELYA